MALCWIIYLIAVVFTFREPVRSGLDELRQREKATGPTVDNKTALVDKTPEEENKRWGHNDDDDDDASYEGSVGSQPRGLKDESHGTSNGLCCGCLRHITKAVVICMSLIFMKRIALESIIGSTSVVTKNR